MRAARKQVGTESADLRREAIRAGHQLEMVSRRAVAELTSGRYRSRFKGRGHSFSEVRAYVPGDEPRSIDWNVTARTGSPHVKVFEEERELVVWLVVDRSGSTAYGSQLRSKAEAACQVAACVAQAALTSGDRVGLITFGSGPQRVVPPRKGRQQAMALFEALTGAGSASGQAGLTDALRHLLELRRRSALVFVISDFDAPEADARTLTAAARRFEVLPVVITDPVELRLPRGGGSVLLEDAETGTRLVIDASDSRVRQAFERQSTALRLNQERLFRRLQADAVWVSPDDDGARALGRLMQRRSLGRRMP